ncbi:hypothetical protein LTR56_022990 [Elasticomyces elasticus]|nr:hypothetical protein LTR56_022990 [Elasticomyces elasticus]KAK4907390.1 hypothetical protein LTR49_023573 [Elasticomyces elasticus]
MPEPFTLAPAREADIAAIIDIITLSFAHLPTEIALGNVDTPAGRQAASARHLHAWRQHAKNTDVPCAIKCVFTDPATREEMIVGFGEWFIYDKWGQYEQVNELISGHWVEDDEKREIVQRWLEPVVDARRKWLHGRRCAVLVYMVVLPEWRRKGVASMIVRWGVDKCRGLGVLAYLEATEEGKQVYDKCGFETMETVWCNMDDGMREEEKVPAVL